MHDATHASTNGTSVPQEVGVLQKLVVIHSMQVARGHALRQVLYQLLRQVLRQALSQVLCQSSLISLNSENGSVSFYTLPKIFFFQNQ